MFQKCPICNGQGTLIDSLGEVKCEVCNGTKIIDEMTGLSPRLPEEKTDKFQGHFSTQTRERFFHCERVPESIGFDGKKLAQEKWDKIKKDAKSREWFHVFLSI